MINLFVWFNLKSQGALLLTFCMQAMGAIPKLRTANLLQIYKRNANFQISAEPAAIACMLLLAGGHTDSQYKSKHTFAQLSAVAFCIRLEIRINVT